MTLSSVAIAVGIFVIVSIIGLYLRSAIANTGLDSEQRKRMAALARNARWEKIASVVFGINLLLGGMNVFHEAHHGAPANAILSSFMAAIAWALCFGVLVGRLRLRQEGRLYGPPDPNEFKPN